ncbi:MAG: tetratricopeptide repeat protein, partial [Planctomycetia bacterium]|nr:tetratricopeptide repeat protein [Planctomycetia bacterium]
TAAGHFAEAEKLLDENSDHAVQVEYWRIRGDYEAVRGKIDEARSSYRKAGKLSRRGRRDRNQFAELGSYERSAEAFLLEARPDEAIRVIREWEAEFPETKVNGAIGFFHAQYWMMRGEYRQAISEARTSAALAPDSPYADRSLLLAAESLAEMGQVEKAIAAYESFVKQYPGSPFVKNAETSVQELKSRATPSPGAKSRKSSPAKKTPTMKKRNTKNG